MARVIRIRQFPSPSRVPTRLRYEPSRGPCHDLALVLQLADLPAQAREFVALGAGEPISALAAIAVCTSRTISAWCRAMNSRIAGWMDASSRTLRVMVHLSPNSRGRRVGDAGRASRRGTGPPMMQPRSWECELRCTIGRRRLHGENVAPQTPAIPGCYTQASGIRQPRRSKPSEGRNEEAPNNRSREPPEHTARMNHMGLRPGPPTIRESQATKGYPRNARRARRMPPLRHEIDNP